MRRALDHDLGEPVRRADPSQIFDLFDSGGADVAHEEDHYLDEAVRAAHRDQGG